MNESQEQPPPDRQNKLNQFSVLMVLLAVAALGAEKALNATTVFGTVIGWTSLVCGGIGFVLALMALSQGRR